MLWGARTRTCLHPSARLELWVQPDEVLGPPFAWPRDCAALRGVTCLCGHGWQWEGGEEMCNLRYGALCGHRTISEDHISLEKTSKII